MRLWPRKQVYVDDLPRTHDLRFAAMFMLLFLALLALLYAVGFFVAGDRLPRGTTIAGVDVGGMKRAEARTVLQDELIPRLERPITVHALGETYEIDPQLAGMTFDLEATLSEGLAGERWDPRHMLRVVLGGGPLATQIDVSTEELNDTLQEIADDIQRPPVEAAVTFGPGQPVATPGDVGVALDFGGSADVLREALLTGDDEVNLPIEEIQPVVTTDAAENFASDVARRAVSGPIRVRVADVVRTVPVAVFAPALGVGITDGALRLTIDAEVLAQRSRAVLSSLPHRPVNAKIAFAGGHPVVVPGRSGVRVEPADWAAAVLRGTAKSGDQRIVTAQVTPDPPDFTTVQARQLEVDNRLVRSQLRIPAQLASDAAAVAARLDGTLLRPGAEFSFVQRAGVANPMAASLVASTVYDAAFRGGMSNMERTAPTVHPRGTEPGLDAKVDSGVDLGWRNSTPYGVYVRAVATSPSRGPGQVTIELWSTKYWSITLESSGRYNVVEPGVERQAGADCRERPGATGFEIDVSRTFGGTGSGQRVETVHSEYAKVDTVVCRRR
jgi:vancomycin resistance protein YoaR